HAVFEVVGRCGFGHRGAFGQLPEGPVAGDVGTVPVSVVVGVVGTLPAPVVVGVVALAALAGVGIAATLPVTPAVIDGVGMRTAGWKLCSVISASWAALIVPVCRPVLKIWN